MISRSAVGKRATGAWALPAIVAIAVLVRVPALGVQSLWSDEGFTAKIATAPLGSAASQIPHTESTPPLYYAVAWAWAHLFGSSEFVLRLPSAIFGCLTVVAVYWLGTAITTRRVSLAAALLAAVSPIMVWYSQEARAYALFVLLSVLALRCFAGALHTRRPRWLIGWAACTVAALATHYFALFPFLAEGAWLWLRVRPRRRVLAALIAPIAACAALAPLALYQEHHVARWWTSAFTVTDQWKAVTQSFLVGISWTPLTHRAGVAVLGLLVVIAAGALVTRGDREERRIAAAIGALAAVTLALPTAVSLVGSNYLAPRNVLYAWPLVALIVALGAARRNAGAWSAAGLVAGAAISLAIVVAVPFTPALQRDDWRALLRPLQTTSSPRALVATDGFVDTPLIEYYLRGIDRPVHLARMREVDVVSDAGQRSLTAAGFLRAAGMRLASEDVRGILSVSVYTAPDALRVPASALAKAGESVLIQAPIRRAARSTRGRSGRGS